MRRARRACVWPAVCSRCPPCNSAAACSRAAGRCEKVAALPPPTRRDQRSATSTQLCASRYHGSKHHPSGQRVSGRALVSVSVTSSSRRSSSQRRRRVASSTHTAHARAHPRSVVRKRIDYLFVADPRGPRPLLLQPSLSLPAARPSLGEIHSTHRLTCIGKHCNPTTYQHIHSRCASDKE